MTILPDGAAAQGDPGPCPAMSGRKRMSGLKQVS